MGLTSMAAGAAIDAAQKKAEMKRALQGAYSRSAESH